MKNMEIIQTFVKIKHMLESIKLYDNNNHDLDEILIKVLNYLQKNCNHELVQDMIDIDIEKILLINK